MDDFERAKREAFLYRLIRGSTIGSFIFLILLVILDVFLGFVFSQTIIEVAGAVVLFCLCMVLYLLFFRRDF